MIDRVAPTHRPPSRNDGTQRWESLLFCHWEVSPELLRPLIPAQLEIDTFQGTAYIGVVPFKMRKIRPRWLPSALAVNFLETNVRTYVLYNNQPGVYFFSLDANSVSAVLAARVGWSLPYYYATMSADQHDGLQQYRSRRWGGQASHDVSFRVSDELGPSVEGSREHFLLERYLMFTERRNQIEVGQVYHQPYHVYLATVEKISDSLVTAAKLPNIDRRPDLVHYCPGVDVEVFGFQAAS
jgi:uncharacterized protein YqjF (DUF2071 family)